MCLCSFHVVTLGLLKDSSDWRPDTAVTEWVKEALNLMNQRNEGICNIKFK